MQDKLKKLYESGFITLPRVSFIELLHDLKKSEKVIKNNAVNDFARLLKVNLENENSDLISMDVIKKNIEKIQNRLID